MQSLLFTPGQAFLSVNSTAVPWTLVFEDEGVAAYCYACDRSHQTQEESILDAVLIYNVSALRDRTTQRLASVEWSRDGQQAVFYLDGAAQALFDFAARRGFSRTDFPTTSRKAAVAGTAPPTPGPTPRYSTSKPASTPDRETAPQRPASRSPAGSPSR